MRTFDETKVWSNYRLKKLYQITPRRYTLTHSDETGELFLVIGHEFAYERFSQKRDEVVGEWLTNSAGQYYFYIYIRLDSIDNTTSAKERNEHFKRELPTALKAIHLGDLPFFQFYPQFECAPIYVFFQSRDKTLNRTENFGIFKNYYS